MSAEIRKPWLDTGLSQDHESLSKEAEEAVLQRSALAKSPLQKGLRSMRVS